MDIVGIVVDDLAAAIAFFVELGLELEGEALTADRPYREAWSPERALEVMRRSAGDHLAAEVVEAIPFVVWRTCDTIRSCRRAS